MKILHTVEFYEPSKGGAQEVVRQLSERLAARGHRVTVATSLHPSRAFRELNGVEIKDFAISGNAVKGVRGDISRYEQFLLQSDFDLLLNYAAQTWTTDLTLPLLDKLKGKKVVAPLGYSRLHSKDYAGYFNTLPQYLAAYDRIVYTSPNYQDKLFGDAHGVGDKAVILPNGASKEEFAQPTTGFKKKFGIGTKYLFLTVSNHYFAKGHLFVVDAFRRLRSGECTLVIVGERPARHGWYSCYPLCSAVSAFNDRVRVLTGVSRRDVVSAYQEADLFLFGSKVECAPLVMYESFASKTPFITTPAGNVRDHSNLIKIVRTPHEMSREMGQFLASPSTYKELAEKAHKLFEEQHTWEHLTDRYEDMYRGLVAD